MSAQKRFWIGTGWKMNHTLADAMEYVSALADLAETPSVQGFVIPPFTVLREVSRGLRQSSFKVGAQNMHWEDSGAWTGEISAAMLNDCQVDLVEIGHSERRTHFGETDTAIGLKVSAALRHHLIPLVCVGETLQQKENGQTRGVLREQVSQALQYVREHSAARTILVAYEPVWAIGESGIPATPDYASAQHQFIKQCTRELLGTELSCLYGGSVDSDNCAELISCKHIDGLFIGRAAWDVHGYIDILARCISALERQAGLNH